MKKSLIFINIIIFAILLSACGSKPTKTVDLSTVKTKIVEDLKIDGAMDIASDKLMDLYGISQDKIKQSACFVTMAGVFPDEVIMLEATDASAASDIEGKLNNRLSEVKNQSKSYDAENYALAQKCAVQKDGNYICLFLSAKYEQMQNIYNGFVK